MCTKLTNHEINQLIIGELYESLYGEKPDPKLLESQTEEQQARSLAHGANELEKQLTALETKPKGDISDDWTGGTGNASENGLVQRHPNLFYPTGDES